jgi:hypothetical protein
MKKGLKLKYSFEAFGLSTNKVSERLTDFGHCVNKRLMYETIKEQKNRSKCAKLARAMSMQNNDETKMKLWNLFKAA